MKNLVMVEINNKIEQTKKVLEDLEEKRYDVFCLQIQSKLDKIIELAMELSDSKYLTSHEFEEWPMIYTDFDYKTLIDSKGDSNLLERFLSEEYFISLDKQNNCAMMSIGPCILVNDDGDVLDQDNQKWVISKSDYETREELKELIEKYMEKTGCYPSVIDCNRNGFMTYFKV